MATPRFVSHDERHHSDTQSEQGLIIRRGRPPTIEIKFALGHFFSDSLDGAAEQLRIALKLVRKAQRDAGKGKGGKLA